jgi:hypothetical protein
MPRLTVELYDRVNDANPTVILDDNLGIFYDLNAQSFADKAARVVMRPGADFVNGDHVRLLDEVNVNHTNTIALDPTIAVDVDLNAVLFNDRGFADKAAAVEIILNPDPTGGYRLRVQLFDTVPQQLPSLVLYEFEFDAPGGLIDPNGEGTRFADLNQFHFADKTARIIVETGPNFQDGDRVRLWDAIQPGTNKLDIEPTEGDGIDLNGMGWADRAAGIQFMFAP